MENRFNVVEGEYANISSNTIAKTYLFMFLGLLATGFTSMYTYNSGLVNTLLLNNGYIFLSIAEIICVLVFSLLFYKLPYILVELLFFGYAILNGLTLSSIFAVYSINSLATIFFASAALFGIFALIGYNSKVDLSKFSTIFLGALMLGIIVSIINMFIGNSIVDIVVSWIMIFLFFGITAYDMQRIKYMSNYNNIDDKLYVYMAMEIYLDFINIFLQLLDIFGRRKN